MSLVTWQQRALGYTLVYFLLCCVLIGIRYSTYEIGPKLRKLSLVEEELLKEKKTLQLETQTMVSAANVRYWALRHNMTPFSKMPKSTYKFSSLKNYKYPRTKKKNMDVIIKWK